MAFLVSKKCRGCGKDIRFRIGPEKLCSSCCKIADKCRDCGKPMWPQGLPKQICSSCYKMYYGVCSTVHIGNLKENEFISKKEPMQDKEDNIPTKHQKQEKRDGLFQHNKYFLHDDSSEEDEAKPDANPTYWMPTHYVDPVDPFKIEQYILEKQETIEIKPSEVKEIQDKIYKKYNYTKQGETKVTKEMLKKGIGVNQKDRLSFTEALESTIETDNNEINNMVLAAKFNLWHLVWSTLDNKPYLVNCIPEERAWSVLHQAIYHDILEVVRRLVEDYGADINIRTKPDRDQIAAIGTNSKVLAYNLKRKEILYYFMKYEKIMKAAVKSQDISFFRQNTTGNVDPFSNYPLFQLTLASYKSFVSFGFSLQDYQSQHLVHLLPGLFPLPTWRDAKIKICNTLYGIDRKQSDSLRDAENKDNFYRMVIKVYTSQSNVYNSLTAALIKQAHSPYKPLANDLAVGPFATMLSTILYRWDRLKPFRGTTYRGVSDDVTSKYEVHQTFFFLNFISTSKSISVAKRFQTTSGTLFIFENENRTWGPRDLNQMSEFTNEDECLFPLGAEFIVVSINKEKREIRMKLLQPSV